MNASDPRHEWMQQYGDGVASAETTARLETALREDAEFRALFLEYLNLDGALSDAAAVYPAESRRKVVAFPVVRWLAAAAALIAFVFFAKLLLPSGTGPGESVARLSRTVAANWEGDAREPGQALAKGSLRLKSGTVQIEFSRGARVVLEGPAEFQLVSNNEGFLKRGKLRAFVPEAAHGFTIRGEEFSVVDRGTEFGVIAGEKLEVHVFAGRVELARTSGTELPRLLGAGSAVRLDGRDWLDVPADTSAFISPDEVNRMERREVSRRSVAALSAHPATVVHYNFEQVTGALPNLVRGRDIPASIAGCEAAEGRWPGKGALEFETAEDRVRFTVPGEMQSLTLLAWVRVDGMPNAQSSLLMGESELPGEVHWYLHREGTVGFSVIAPDGRWQGAKTPALLRRELFGTWLFLAVTFDGATGTATHYFNGQAVATQALDRVGPLRLRTVEVGNWGLRPGATLRASKNVLKEPSTYVRNLRGRVDEFAILSAPLSAKEIQHLYETARPPAPSLSK